MPDRPALPYMTDDSVTLPATVVHGVDGEKWIILSSLAKKFIVRAASIDNPRRESTKGNQHRAAVTVAEGSVICRPKSWFLNLDNI